MNFKIDELSDEELLKMAAEFEKIELEMNEIEQKNQPIEVPKELDVKMLEMIREFERIESEKSNKAKKRRYMRIAAMFFVCILLGMTALTMNVDAFRIKLFDFIVEDHSEYIDVNIVEKGNLPPDIVAKFPEEWESVFYPMAMPEEYELVEASEFIGTSLYFVSKNEKDRGISLEYVKNGESTISINGENCKKGETTIKGKEAIYTESEEYTMLIWSDSGYEFVLSVDNIDFKEAVKIAESVVYVKLK